MQFQIKCQNFELLFVHIELHKYKHQKYYYIIVYLHYNRFLFLHVAKTLETEIGILVQNYLMYKILFLRLPVILYS